MDVGGWLRSLGLGQYEALFRASEIDADIPPELTDFDLEYPDPLRQLRAGPRRQIVARLPTHCRQRLVPEALSDAAVGAASGGARVRDNGAGLPHRHLGRRGADRTRARNLSPAFLWLSRPRGRSKWTR